MSVYNITLTDPLSNSFSIQPGGFDGPGGVKNSTTLRLYGHGALEWGEAVNENLVRLLENFSGASAPLNPIHGQLWSQVSSYIRVESGTQVSWYYYDYTRPVGKWVVMQFKNAGDSGVGNQNYTTSGAPGASVVPTGAYPYAYSSASRILYRYMSSYNQAPATWIERVYAKTTTPPTDSVYPIVQLKTYDAARGKWQPPVTLGVGTGPERPLTTQPGTMWYNTTDGTLWLYVNQTQQWQQIAGPGKPGIATPPTINSDLNMNGNTITNLVPVAVPDVCASNYVMSGTSVCDFTMVTLDNIFSQYVPLTGTVETPPPPKPVTGALIINQALKVDGTSRLNGLGSQGTAVTSLFVGTGGLPTPALRVGEVKASSITITGAATSGVVTTTSASTNTSATARDWTFSTSLTSTNTATASSNINIQGPLSIGTSPNMGGARIRGVADAVIGTDAVTKNQVDAKAAEYAPYARMYTSTAVVPSKPGDFCVVGGTIYIYNAGWRQIYPALYSIA